MKNNLHPFAIAAVWLGAIYLVWLLFVINGVAGNLFFILELLVYLLFVLFCYNHWHRKYQLSGGSYSLRAMVDIFIATKNEPREMIRKTITAAANIYHPNTRIYLIDDGNRPQIKKYAEAVGITYLVRDNHQEKQFKAAALNHALQQSYGQYILVLDADQVVQPIIVDSLLGHFKDEQVAYVATRQNFSVSDDDFNHDHLFYEYMQTGKNDAAVGISCGSGVIYRREALEKIGGFQEWNIVEDLYTSYVLISEGYKSVYVNQSFTLGTAPTDLPTIYKQRGVWAADTLRLCVWKMPLLNNKLTFNQRLHYFEMGYIYLVSAFIIPCIYFLNFYSLFFNVHIIDAGIVYLLLKLPSFYCILTVYNELGQGSASSRMWASLFCVYLKSLIQACSSKKPVYTVTKKILVKTSQFVFIWPHLVLISIGITALLYHLITYGYSGLLFINIFWLVLMGYWFWIYGEMTICNHYVNSCISILLIFLGNFKIIGEMKKILIAEDEKSLALTLYRKVSSLGYECIQARDGEETIKKFKSEKPDLVLLDVVMPYKNGFEVLEEIRIREHSTVPVIILSNLGQNEDLRIGEKLKANEYFIKSNISLQELSTKIHELLS